MFVKSLFITSFYLSYYISSILSEFSQKSQIKTISLKSINVYKDFNHPGNLVHIQDLHWTHYILDNEVRKKVGECKSINRSLIPAYSDTNLKIFHEDFRQWWAIFEYSQSEVIQHLKQELEHLTKAVTNKEKAALISHLSTELHQISEKKIVYERSVSVNESDVESIINALRAWSVNDEELLNAARAVYRVWGGNYSKDNVVWPRKV